MTYKRPAALPLTTRKLANLTTSLHRLSVVTPFSDALPILVPWNADRCSGGSNLAWFFVPMHFGSIYGYYYGRTATALFVGSLGGLPHSCYLQLWFLALSTLRLVDASRHRLQYAAFALLCSLEASRVLTTGISTRHTGGTLPTFVDYREPPLRHCSPLRFAGISLPTYGRHGLCFILCSDVTRFATHSYGPTFGLALRMLRTNPTRFDVSIRHAYSTFCNVLRRGTQEPTVCRSSTFGSVVVLHHRLRSNTLFPTYNTIGRALVRSSSDAVRFHDIR